MATIAVTIRFPVIETFGPTVQGEGPDAGRPAHFVRFGGCDFRCIWCDSKYAVEPTEVRATAEYLTGDAVRSRVASLNPGPRLVVLTGGNPALLELGSLVEGLHEDGFAIAVETQGSVYKPWLATVDRVVVSPKGPSSGMDDARHWAQIHEFMSSAQDADAHLALKVVVFDESDLAYACRVKAAWPDTELHLSVGTDPEAAGDLTTDRAAILDRLGWLAERVSMTAELADVRVQPQLHVLAWGRRRGV